MGIRLRRTDDPSKAKLSQMTKKKIQLRALENQIKYFSFGNENFSDFDVRVRVLSISYNLDFVFSIFLAFHLPVDKASVPAWQIFSSHLLSIFPTNFPFFVARGIGVQYDVFRS